jgi:hypothetical protein
MWSEYYDRKAVAAASRYYFPQVTRLSNGVSGTFENQPPRLHCGIAYANAQNVCQLRPSLFLYAIFFFPGFGCSFRTRSASSR